MATHSPRRQPASGWENPAAGSGRAALLLGGGGLALLGMRRGGVLGAGLALAGSALAVGAASGLVREGGFVQRGMGELQRRLPALRTAKVRRSVTIARPRSEVWPFLRDFTNMPRWARHVVSVTDAGDGRSHWVVRAPAGTTLEWDVAIEAETPEERVSWQSLPGSDIRHAGLISLHDAPGGRGTEVHVSVAYDAPGGRLGEALAWMLGEEPNQQAREDLRRLKMLLETGELATNAMRREDAGRESF